MTFQNWLRGISQHGRDKITRADNIHREAILATMTGVAETRALLPKALDEASGRPRATAVPLDASC